ncbi:MULTISPECIES: hypothetical protein [unclassified Halorhabdus]|nr:MULTISPECIES: hypothetical protein [unclassified Halorhabdus]WEL21410.1 hypothetical protein HBNXHr_1347 [Halorhabdus sp. BNX81]
MTDELSVEAYFRASEQYDAEDVTEIPEDVREDINATLRALESNEN